MTRAFDFGENWKSYSQKALDEKKFSEAMISLQDLFERRDFRGLRFLDIGCGSGIFSVAAKKLGAKEVVGIDISAHSIEASKRNAKEFGLSKEDLTFFQADILKPETLGNIQVFDAVYAWGCLHHTGQMWQAVENTTRLVGAGGSLVLALYNRHGSSAFWKAVKVLYAHSPGFMKRVLVGIFYVPIYVAKWFLTRKDPMNMKRGMDYYHDIVDWVGGYPYEYASVEEVVERVERLGFRLRGIRWTDLLVGNNQYFFESMKP